MRSYCHRQENKFQKLLYDNLREREKERNTCLKILEKASKERNHSSPTSNKKKRSRETGKFFSLRNASKIEGFFFSFFFSDSSFLLLSAAVKIAQKWKWIKSISINTQKKRPRFVCVFFLSCLISNFWIFTKNTLLQCFASNIIVMSFLLKISLDGHMLLFRVKKRKYFLQIDHLPIEAAILVWNLWYGYGLVWYSIVWYGMVWYVWFGLIWYGVVWYVWLGLIRSGMVCLIWFNLVWYVLLGLIWSGMV